MKKLQILGILFFAIILSSCNQDSSKMVKQITDAEKELYAAGSPIPDKTKVKEILDLYTKFADTYSKDTMAPVYLYKAANLSMNTNQNEGAIALLDRIIKDYSNFSKLPEVYFLKAFIYDNNIKNIAKAREAYTVFLQKFPKNDLANDASISLDNLGKTPEEIINGFKTKEIQKSDSMVAAQQKKK
ncbi:MAG: tetratricopeptide repeat protein [Bacteroidota bacterium]